MSRTVLMPLVMSDLDNSSKGFSAIYQSCDSEFSRPKGGVYTLWHDADALKVRTSGNPQKNGSPGRTRTCNISVNSRMLYR